MKHYMQVLIEEKGLTIEEFANKELQVSVSEIKSKHEEFINQSLLTLKDI